MRPVAPVAVRPRGVAVERLSMGPRVVQGPRTVAVDLAVVFLRALFITGVVVEEEEEDMPKK